jgi:hypothetical protein
MIGNDYELLEQFLINATDNLKSSWKCAIGTLNPYAMEFNLKDSNNIKILNIKFESEANELRVTILDTKKNYETISVDIDKVPNLITYLAETRNRLEYQPDARKFIDENQFTTINLDIDNILRDGKLNGVNLVKNANYATSFSLEINKNEKTNIWATPISDNYLGFQKVIVTLFDTSEDEPLSFNRFIPLKDIAKFPFLNSIAKIPEYDKKNIDPDIKKFINYFSKSKCQHLSPIAKQILLIMDLESELNPQKNEKNKKAKL